MLTLENFNLQTFNSAIDIYGSTGIVVKECNFSGNDIAVVMYSFTNTTLEHNLIIGNTQGITTFDGCSFDIIIGNQILNNSLGGL
jgi:parallel beta-helix repeat protein